MGRKQFKIWIVFCLSLLLPLFVCHAQTQDELHQQLEYADSIRSEDPQQVRLILDSIEPGQLRRPIDIDLYQFLQAHLAAIAGDKKQAIQQLLNIVDDAYLEESRLRAYAKLITNYLYLNQWEDSIFYGNLLANQLEKIRAPKIRHQAIYSLTELYIKQGNYQAALGMLENSPKVQDISQWGCTFSSLLAESKIGLRASFSEVEIEQLSQIAIQCRDIGDQYDYLIIRALLAEYYMLQQQPDRAIELLVSDLESMNALDSLPMLSGQYSLLLKAEYQVGNLEMSELYAHKVLELGKQEPNPGAEKDAYDYLTKIAEQQGNPQQALDYYRNYQEIVKAEFTADTARQMAILNGTQGAKAREKAIKLRATENSLLKANDRLNNQERRARQVAIFLLCCMVLLLLVLIVRGRKASRQLRLYAETDSLTGVMNRRYFVTKSMRVLTACRRKNKPATLVLLDLDNFKTINDRFGHSTGDWAIKNAMEMVQLHCEHGELIGRISGEEFAVLIPDRDSAAVIELVERFRFAITAINTAATTFKFSLSASFGVTDTSVSAYNLEKLMKNADQVLYQAKQQGRNRVVVYSPEACEDEQKK